jgi:hypothetical protein
MRRREARHQFRTCTGPESRHQYGAKSDRMTDRRGIVERVSSGDPAELRHVGAHVDQRLVAEPDALRLSCRARGKYQDRCLACLVWVYQLLFRAFIEYAGRDRTQYGNHLIYSVRRGVLSRRGGVSDAIQRAATVTEGADRLHFPRRHPRVQGHRPCVQLADREQQRNNLQPIFSNEKDAVARTNAQLL